MAQVSLVKLPSDECPCTLLMLIDHWCHMVSLGHKEFGNVITERYIRKTAFHPCMHYAFNFYIIQSGMRNTMVLIFLIRQFSLMVNGSIVLLLTLFEQITWADYLGRLLGQITICQSQIINSWQHDIIVNIIWSDYLGRLLSINHG